MVAEVIMFYNEVCDLVHDTFAYSQDMLKKQFFVCPLFNWNRACQVHSHQAWLGLLWLSALSLVAGEHKEGRWSAVAGPDAACSCTATVACGSADLSSFFSSSGLGYLILLELVPFRPSKLNPIDATLLA